MITFANHGGSLTVQGLLEKDSVYFLAQTAEECVGIYLPEKKTKNGNKKIIRKKKNGILTDLSEIGARLIIASDLRRIAIQIPITDGCIYESGRIVVRKTETGPLKLILTKKSDKRPGHFNNKPFKRLTVFN